MTSAMDFMGAAKRVSLNGNTPWASRYAGELRRVVTEVANSSPRNLQRQLGPSELGVPCDRQVVGKLAGLPTTNHVVDPWASVIGTAVHAWLADAFAADNLRHGLRWVVEKRVTPHPDHPGSGDLYDAWEQAVVDHKILGVTTHEKVKDADGPPIKYKVQLMLYGKGFRLLGLPVKRIAVAAYPRTKHTLDDLYVWEQASGPQDDPFLDAVFELTDHRKALAGEVIAGRMSINDVTTSADDDECFFCPYYRPQSARDQGPGCAGPRKSTTH